MSKRRRSNHQATPVPPAPKALRRVPFLGALVAMCLVLIACGTLPQDDDHETCTPIGEEACTVTAPASCPDPAVTYGDIEPILVRDCVTCHDGTQDIWPLNEYGHVAAWYDEIRTEMLECGMPPPDTCSAITPADREKILAWIRCGTPP